MEIEAEVVDAFDLIKYLLDRYTLERVESAVEPKTKYIFSGDDISINIEFRERGILIKYKFTIDNIDHHILNYVADTFMINGEEKIVNNAKVDVRKKVIKELIGKRWLNKIYNTFVVDDITKIKQLSLEPHVNSIKLIISGQCAKDIFIELVDMIRKLREEANAIYIVLSIKR